MVPLGLPVDSTASAPVGLPPAGAAVPMGMPVDAAPTIYPSAAAEPFGAAVAVTDPVLSHQGPAVATVGAMIFSHQAPDGAWEQYPIDQSQLIAAHLAQQPVGGRVALPGLPFEVRWGVEAQSAKLPTPPTTGIIQVNVHSGNTRIVREESAATPSSIPPSLYSHQSPDGRWEAYSSVHCAFIAQAQAAAPAGGRAALPGIPFEIRWGSQAHSSKLPTPPQTGMVQVNLNSGNTRVVRREAASSMPSLHIPSAALPTL